MLFDEYREECENIRHSLTNSANECMLLCPVRIRTLAPVVPANAPLTPARSGRSGRRNRNVWIYFTFRE